MKPLPNYERRNFTYTNPRSTGAFVARVMAERPKLIAVDTETWYNPDNTTAITRFPNDTPNNEPFGVAFYYNGEGYWITDDLPALKPLLECEDIAKVFHNAKYDLHMFLNIGIEVKGIIHDTMIMVQLINEEFQCKSPKKDGKGITWKRSKKLKDLAYHFFGDGAHYLEDLVDDYRAALARQTHRKKDEVSYREVMIACPELMMDYAVSDTEYTYRLYYELLPDMDQQNLWDAYRVDMNATFSTLKMERRGICIDQELLDRYDATLDEILEDSLAKLRSMTANSIFNPDSNEQVVKMYRTLGVREWPWKTEKGELRSDEWVINRAKEKFSDVEGAEAFSDEILRYRVAHKMSSTYVKGLRPYIQADGKVHCSYWVSPNDFGTGGTKTGRLSSSQPNLQNIPKGEVLDGINIRSLFVPSEGYVFVKMDYDQQEYRLLGHYGKDENFMQYIREGKDIHTSTAAMVFNVPYEEVTKEQRAIGKTTNFAVVYGLGNSSFANSMGYDIDIDEWKKATEYLYKKRKPWELPPYGVASLEEMLAGVKEPSLIRAITYFYSDYVQEAVKFAKAKKDEYFSRFPGIKKFIKDCTEAVRRRGYVKTWTGRRRHFANPRDEAYRGPNSVIQGGCGDIAKVKLSEFDSFFEGRLSAVVNTVHDEFLYEIHKSEMSLIPEIKRIQEDLDFSVPITCSAEIGEHSWGELEPYEC